MANAYSVVIEGALCREATAVTITVTLTTNLAKLPGDAAPQGANCNCIYRAVDVLLFLCSTLLANQGLFVLSVDKGTNPALLAKLLSLEHVGCIREEE